MHLKLLLALRLVLSNLLYVCVRFASFYTPSATAASAATFATPAVVRVVSVVVNIVVVVTVAAVRRCCG